ncbi:DUF6119 family protein [Legionella sp. WA2024007413]
MSKARSFSVYLLKDGYDVTNALKEDHKLLSNITANKLPEKYKLYLLDSHPSEPWWKSYFGINQHLEQELKGAIIFIPVENRNFALTFGHVAHNFKDTAYEYDFGLRVTLNCLDPLKLKSLDSLQPSNTLRQRSQLPIGSDLTYFDFDQNSSILKSLTGMVKDKYKSLFKHATGSSNLRISSDVSPEGLHDLCTSLLQLYKSEEFIKEFPNIQNIAPLKDPEEIEFLNQKLIAAIKNKDENIILTIPDIINYTDALFAAFSGAGKSLVYSDVFINQYYEYLGLSQFDVNNLSIDILKKHRLVLTNEDGTPRGEHPSILKCILFNFTHADKTYHLCEGNWYLVSNDFLEKLTVTIDPICADTTLITYDHDNEEAFNAACENFSIKRLCLDRKNISLQGQHEVEPCDILEIIDNLFIMYHVKRNTISAQLSHLFNQGLNSIQLIFDEEKVFENLKLLIIEKLPKEELPYKSVKDLKFKISYQIITKKNKNGKTSNLPLFSRISFYRAIKSLRRMSIDTELCFITDERKITSEKKKLKRKSMKQA